MMKRIIILYERAYSKYLYRIYYVGMFSERKGKTIYSVGTTWVRTAAIVGGGRDVHCIT